jgi:predicted TIM-barrel fold metal-dependent hydrolase
VGRPRPSGPPSAPGDTLVLISVDDHIIEPPDLFVHHLDAKYLDRAPKMVRNDEGSDVWQFGAVVMETAALNAVAGRPREEYGLEPQSLDEVRPGCYDVHERVKDMNAGGVLASMNFPSFPTFTARCSPATTPSSRNALVRAYNDWHIDEWCGAYPARFIPMAVPVIWDAELTAVEIRRTSAKGCHSLSFTENPAALGYPSFHDDYWDPVWKACCDTGTVLSIHLGSSGRLSIPAVDSPPDVMITLQPMNIQSAAADLLWSRVLKNFPTSAWRSPRAGTGWIPYFLERVDRTYEMHRAWTLQDFGGRLPSEVFREHFLTCFISDPVGVALRDRIGIDNIAWEADYPHSDSMWPSAPEELGTVFATYSVPDDDIAKMTHENAMRWYSFDPFSTCPRRRRRWAPCAARRRVTTCRSWPAAPGCVPGREARGVPRSGLDGRRRRGNLRHRRPVRGSSR